MRWIMKILGQGFMAVIPLTLTLSLVIGLGVWAERLLANPFKGLLPESSEFYRMGMGILSFLLLVFLIGLMMNFWLVRRLFSWVEGRIRQLPLVKTVYGAIQDVMQFLGGKGEKKGDMVVVIQMENGWRQLGIVTRQDFSGLPAELLGEQRDRIAVYLPFSYQLGGFCYFVERSQCTPVPGMSVEDAMRYAMMAWLGSGGGSREAAKKQAVPETDAEQSV